MKEAREALGISIISYHGQPLGTIAALDPEVEALSEAKPHMFSESVDKT